MSSHALPAPSRPMSVLRTQLSGVLRRPARLLLTGLAILVASFVVFATVLAQQMTERTIVANVSGTPATADLVVGGDTGQLGDSPAVTTTMLDAVKKASGVAEAVGRVSVGMQVGTSYVNIEADPGVGPLAVTHVLQGAFPTKDDQIAVTQRTADRMGLPIGTVTSLTSGEDNAKPVSVSVTGIVAGADDNGRSAYALDSAVRRLMTDRGAVQQIDVRLAPGVDREAARSAVQSALGGPAATRPQVATGDEVRLAEAKRAVSDIDSLFAVVAMFVAIAVVAAALVATSTFRIVFAQRMRQLALLRAVGAARGKITRALALEGALTGFVAGLVGVLGALLLGHVLPPILGAFDVEVQAPGFPIGSALAVIALAVFITVVSVLAPAFSAAKVAPLEALRASSTTAGKSGIGKARWIIGLLLVAGAAGIAALVLVKLPGRDAKNYSPAPMLLGVVASGALAYFALVALGPVLVRPLLRAVGWPLRHSGPVGRLAVGGIGGAPRRAAAVSVVVALGVTLIAGVVVSGASMQVLSDREMAASVPADYELTGADGGIPADLIDKARASKDLAHVTPYRRLEGITVGGIDYKLSANDLDMAALPTLGQLDFAAGSLAGAGPGKAVIADFIADNAKLKLGDTVTLAVNGKSTQVAVGAILAGSTPLQSEMVLNRADLDKLGAQRDYNGVLADAAATGEAGRNAGQKALKDLTAGKAGLGVTVLADERDQIQNILNAVLGVAVGLIGLTVLIAVVGVGTTTALSVVERIRESGLLRAVGLSRAGLRAMLTAESSLYGVIGATIGLALGIPYAWLSVKALGVNAPLELPVLQLVGVFLTLVVVTALAGVLPARKASRVSPVTALGTDG
jgi:putative ABC transport system permease protein